MCMNTIKQLLSDYLKEASFNNHPLQALYEPIDYIFSLGGKRMRPMLALLSCQLFSDDVKPALPVAYAIEMFHNFSLVHDDIMDEAALRRGQPTIHEKYNTNTAILSGDVMLLYAYKHLHKTDPQYWTKILPIFTDVAIGVCEGQQMDVDFEERNDVKLSDYLRMIELKTSVLLYGAMKMGALIGGSTEEDAELAGEFGRNMGIAFQIKDDWLDTYGAQAKVGKRIGGDIIQNKKTALVIKALELADKETAQRLRTLLSTTPPAEEETQKIAEVTAIFTQVGIPDQMAKLMEVYRQKAQDSLDRLQKTTPERKAPLYHFLEAFMARES